MKHHYCPYCCMEENNCKKCEDLLNELGYIDHGELPSHD